MKKALLTFMLLSAVMLGLSFYLFRSDAAPKPDIVSINDAVMTAMQSNDQAEAVNLLTRQLTQAYENMDTARKNRDKGLLAFLCVFIAIYTASAICLYLYCDQSVLKPFRRLRRFARYVAEGNLDIPLEMDKHGGFGAFTESFDLMREELKKAWENECRASNATGKSGSGLGLFISRHLMNKMGGDIRCEQSQNCFTLKILLAI